MMPNVNNNNENQNPPRESEPDYQTREEYLEKLSTWLNNARTWQNLCLSMPYYQDIQNHVRNGTLFAIPSNPNANNDVPNQNDNVPVFQFGPTEFVIPPMWKRITAEFLDFLLLLAVKLIFTVLVIENFYLMSLDYYKMDSFKKNLQDPKIAMQLSSEILVIEFLHRVMVCMYEVYWLKGGPCATPGKRYMGLMVIYVEEITPVSADSDDVVRINIWRPLGLQKAMGRAILKNIFLGIMLPLFFTLYIFRFNRTGYDAITNSLVVENPQFQHVR